MPNGKYAQVDWEAEHVMEQCNVPLTEEEATDFLRRNGAQIKDCMVDAGVKEVDSLLPAFLKSIGKG